MGKITIYTGPAGCGKTYNAIKEFLASASKGDVLFPDRHSFLIVPEQLTVEIENKLLASAETGGLIASEVISFNRLIYKILSDSNRRTGIPLTPSMRAMLLVKVLKNNEKKLKYFKSTQEKPFAVAKLGSTITELEKYLVDSSTLENAAAEYEQTHAEDKMTADKLRDIALIKKAFTDELTGKYADAQLLAGEAIELIKSGKTCVTGSNVFVDSFSGFTKVELEILKEISLQCSCMSIYCFEPDYESSFFGCPKETIRTLKDTLESSGNVFEKVSLVNNASGISRFSNSDELYHLSKNYGKIAPKNATLLKNKDKPHDIIFAAEGEFYHELEAAANYIKSLVASGKYGWSDIAVAIPSLDTKQYLADAVFKGRNIPTFIDARLERSGHPVIRLADAFLRICAGELNKNTLTALIRTGLVACDGVAITRDDADILENAFMAANVRSQKSFTKCVERLSKKYENAKEKPSHVSAAEKLLDLFCNDSDGILIRAKQANTVGDALNLFLDFAAGVGLDENFSQLSKLDKGGDPELVRTWNVFVDIIDECRLAIGDISKGRNALFTFTDDALMAAVSCFLVGSIPSFADCVQVGDIDRSLYLDKKVIMILGANEGCFPAEPPDDSFLGDTEREAIKNVGGRTSYNSLERTLLMQFNVYSKILAASEKLYISYSLTDEKGNEVTRAAALDSIERLFEETGRTERLVLLDKETEDDPLDQAKKVALDPELVKSLLHIKDSFRTGVTSLDTYRECPYKYFLEKIAALKEREDGSVQYNTLGSFMHKIFETAVKTAVSKQADFRNLKLEDWNGYVEDAVKTVVNDSDVADIAFLAEISNKNQFYTGRAKISSAHELRHMSGKIDDGFNPADAELSYGFDEVLPSLDITVNGTAVTLRLVGSIDRVDIKQTEDGKAAVALIDYKSGSNSSDPTMGRLQLPIYFKALENGIEHFKKKHNLSDVEIVKLAYYYYSGDTYKSGRQSHTEYPVDPSVLSMDTLKKKADKNEQGFASLEEYAEKGLEIAAETAGKLTGGEFTPDYSCSSCNYCNYSFMCGRRYSKQAEQSAEDNQNGD